MFKPVLDMIEAVRFTFAELHKIQFAAPWHNRPRRCRSAGPLSCR